jgi:hypothetical protein
MIDTALKELPVAAQEKNFRESWGFGGAFHFGEMQCQTLSLRDMRLMWRQ